MKKFAFILPALFLAACGNSDENCSVQDNGDTVSVTCGDSSAVIRDGEDGKDGLDGKDASMSDLLNLVTDIFQSHSDSVLDVECYLNDQFLSRGTGTKTVSGTIITAHHVIKDCDATLYWSGTTQVGAGGSWVQVGQLDMVEVDSINWNSDGNNLAGVSPRFNYFPSVGELLISLHLPVDIHSDVQASTGYVVDNNVTQSLSFSNQMYWRGAFTSDYAAASGSSGAPVFDSNGNWIAIHVGGYNSGGLELNYSLPLQ